MAVFTHILVPTDFGDSADHAVEIAVELAKKLDAKITLFHAWSVPTPTYAEALAWPLDQIREAAQASLESAHAQLKAKHANTEAVLDVGPAAERIVAAAKDRKADLIIMGTHGRRGLPRFFLGSVAEKVVRLSPVPVMTVGAESEPRRS